MEFKNELSTFIEATWSGLDNKPNRPNKYLDESLQEILTDETKIESNVHEILFLASLGFKVNLEQDEIECRDFKCQIIIQKPNKEVIPVYVREEDDNVEIPWEKILKKSEKDGWKFALVTNGKSWTLYGLDTSSDQPMQMSYNFVKIKNVNNIKLRELRILFKTLFIMIGFDLENDLFQSYNESNSFSTNILGADPIIETNFPKERCVIPSTFYTYDTEPSELSKEELEFFLKDVEETIEFFKNDTTMEEFIKDCQATRNEYIESLKKFDS